MPRFLKNEEGRPQPTNFSSEHSVISKEKNSFLLAQPLLLRLLVVLQRCIVCPADNSTLDLKTKSPTQKRAGERPRACRTAPLIAARVLAMQSFPYLAKTLRPAWKIMYV
jgi:hypothetical protein